MANLVDSMGYSIGKVHSGLIAYLCNLSRIDKVDEPFRTFCRSLRIALPRDPFPHREWNSVDLAIMQGKEETPHTLIEMKVDDHENEQRSRKTGEKLMQTVAYANSHPGCESYLFVTLGMGEYFSAPASDKFDWIRLRRFFNAIDEIKTSDPFIEHWRFALKLEIERQDLARRGDLTNRTDYRGGARNMYLLGSLKERLEANLKETREIPNLKSTCYTHGRGPDTILNFGWHHKTIYMEITNSGKLRLKTSLAPCSGGQAEKLQIITSIQKSVCNIYHDVPVPPSIVAVKESSLLGKSKTIATFDVGLDKKGGLLSFSVSEESTCAQIKLILEKFYNDQSWSAIATAAPSHP